MTMLAREDTRRQAQKLLAAACVLLIVIGCLRLLALTLHSPVFAYANQSDQDRISSCTSLWPTDEQGHFRSGATLSAPFSQFLSHDIPHANCDYSTAAIFAVTAKELARWSTGWKERSAFDIRYLGMLYAIAIASMAVCFDRYLQVRSTLKPRMIHAALYAAVLTDPMVSLFFNTYYTEAPAVIGLYGLTALTAFSRHPFSGRNAALITLFAVCLGFSRSAHFALPLLFSCLLLWRSWHVETWRKFVPMAIAVAIMVLQPLTGTRSVDVALANRTNAIMHALAPQSDDPLEWIRSLNLPVDCARLVGASWYLRLNHDIEQTCPTLQTLSLPTILLALAKEPLTLLSTMHKSILLIGTWRITYLGEIEGGLSQRVSGLRGTSVSDLWPLAPFPVKWAMLVLPICAGAVAAVQQKKSATDWLLLVLGSTTLVVWVVSLVGDGYSELARHMHLAAICSLATIIAMAAQLTGIAGLRSCLCAVALCFATTFAPWAHAPVAIAVLDASATPIDVLVIASTDISREKILVRSAASDNILLEGADSKAARLSAYFAVPLSRVKHGLLVDPYRFGAECEPLSIFITINAAELPAFRVCARPLE